MKHFFCIFLAAICLFDLTACASAKDGYISTPSSKDYVEEFMDIIEESEMAGQELSSENCYNVTPESVAAQTDHKIFKFTDSAMSLVLIDGAAYTICGWFGGHGFLDAEPWDYDGDGDLDLLVASSCGSGIHRSIISVFNTVTKESTVIYDTFTTDDPQIDLVIEPADQPGQYQIYSVNIDIKKDDTAALSYKTAALVGTVTSEAGIPTFKAQ